MYGHIERCTEEKQKAHTQTKSERKRQTYRQTARAIEELFLPVGPAGTVGVEPLERGIGSDHPARQAQTRSGVSAALFFRHLAQRNTEIARKRMGENKVNTQHQNFKPPRTHDNVVKLASLLKFDGPSETSVRASGTTVVRYAIHLDIWT